MNYNYEGNFITSTELEDVTNGIFKHLVKFETKKSLTAKVDEKHTNYKI